ncbi:hypothetical protein ABI59_15205 [Acidobacteria bacterium Mor1]|nr:hypothetical protein ABI59_15205 [Acidobacteria bacterium Mor1]
MNAPSQPPIRGLLLAAVAVLVIFGGALAAWSLLAPLQSGAVASGRVNVADQRKTLQHLEGGIIRELLVREGQTVAAGDVILRLEGTRARAALELQEGQLDQWLARHARLIAQRDGSTVVDFPSRLRERSTDAEVATLMADENSVLAAARRTLSGRRDLLEQDIRRTEQEIRSLQARLDADRLQLELAQQERERLSELAGAGIAAPAQLKPAESEVARITGSIGRGEALIARAHQSIAKSRLEMEDLDNTARSQAVQEITEAQGRIDETRERIVALADQVRRTELRAPVSGTVVGLRFHTAGGVLRPGEPVLDLVPRDETLVIDARVRPTDIDLVQPGLPAQVRLTALPHRTTPLLDGVVTRVSADVLHDEASGAAYFLAQVRVEDPQAWVEDKLYPGMPADVLILAGEQTAFSYLTAPLRDSFQRAFREL